MLNGLHVIIGCNGPVGVELAHQLVARGHRIRGICRTGRAEFPPGAEVMSGDATDSEEMRRLCADASVIYCCVGLPYRQWRGTWPRVIDGILNAASGRRLVFADNLYAYGPQTSPLKEEMPLTGFGHKPRLRAQMATRMLQAHRDGLAQVVLVRASDFYGPRVTNALLGARVFSAAVSGKPAQLLPDIDQPHTFTYISDFAGALVTLAEAPNSVCGRAWHVPNAPPQTIREIVGMIYRMVGREPKLKVMPPFLLSCLALASPLMRELKEMTFQLDRPYLVDHSDYAARFWSDPMPLHEGLRATFDWYLGLSVRRRPPARAVRRSPAHTPPSS